MPGVKDEVRVLGIDDGPFSKLKGDTEVIVLGVFFRGGNFMDGLLSTSAAIDGDDATGRISDMILGSKFYPQLQCVMLNGISVGGFNVIDVQRLSSETSLPLIVVVRDHPDFNSIFSALKKLGMESKISLIEKAGRIQRIGNVHAQLVGISLEKASEIIRVTAVHSFLPEPLRIAHIIASGLVFGESRGKA